ncbi:uncharacterized protein TNCV_4818581 [Trichonephila clavipes]|nr:uncharacterized protein TNCV_4818581 [Trichonephila clavipes]
MVAKNFENHNVILDFHCSTHSLKSPNTMRKHAAAYHHFRRELYWLGRGSRVAKVIMAGLVTSSSPVPLKTHRIGHQCTSNLSRAQTSSRWCGVVVRRGGASSGSVYRMRSESWLQTT